MKIRDIQLAEMSRYRGELMGAAIVFIILFHVPLARSVDMFLFLSGIGLWYSWVKNPSVSHFYKRRLLRIFPTWLVISSIYYLQRFNFETGDYLDLFLDITVNWGFWLNDELTFWYVPAIMMLYLWAPLYMKLIQQHPVYRWLPVLMVCWCVIVQWVVPIHQAVGHIEIFWSSDRACRPMAGVACFSDDGCSLYLAGTGAAWAFSALRRAHALYPAYRYTYPNALRSVPYSSWLVSSWSDFSWWPQSGDLSDP